MKKILLIFLSFIFLQVNAQTLKGGVVEEFVPEGFFGSWGVISKLESSNNPSFFNYESRDIWILSGYENILILDNLESGAHSEVILEEKSTDGKTLKFKREKIVNENGNKIIYKETVSFILNGNNFSGFDEYLVEKYQNNGLIEKNEARYIVKGVKISGENPK